VSVGRPVGVTVLAVLIWIVAVLQILVSVLLIVGAIHPDGVTVVAAWATLIIASISFVVSFGLLSGSNLARIVETIALGLSLVTAVIQVFQQPSTVAASAATVVLTALAIALLYTPRAQRFFGS